MPASVSVPVPAFVRDSAPLPFESTPEKVEDRLPALPTVSVAAVLVVMGPDPAMAPAVVAKPPRLKVPPETVKVPVIVVVPNRVVVPALTVTLLNVLRVVEVLLAGKVFTAVSSTVPLPSVKISVVEKEPMLAQINLPPAVIVIVPKRESEPVLPRTTAPETVSCDDAVKVNVPAPKPVVVPPN